MKTFFWSEGRLGWPLIAAVVWATASILLLDFSWRTLVTPLPRLLLGAFVLECAALAILAIGLVALRRSRSRG